MIMKNSFQIIFIVIFVFLNILFEKLNYVEEFIVRPNNITNLFNNNNEFIMICKNETFFLGAYNYKDPKISVIVPIYNGQLTISSTIRSIQHQNMSEIEIILIDDYSTDNSIEIINKIKKEDKRIKLIRNLKQKGTLYTRSIGALKSNAKYIMSIDQDDLFINNIFNICYNESVTNNIDILEFSGLYLDKPLFDVNSAPIIPYYLRFKKNGVIIKQPELSTFIYAKKFGQYKLIDALIWGKCIKTEIYKKALQLLGEEIYTSNICWSEDRIVNFAIFKVANIFKFINIFGIIHQRLQLSVGNNWINTKIDKIVSDEFSYILSLYKINRNTNSLKKFVINELRNIVKNYKGINKKTKRNIICQILKYKYISKNDKKKIIRFIAKLN